MEKPKEEQEAIDKGYKFLGWQVHTGNNDDLKKCHELGHMGHLGQDKRRVKDKQHNSSGSNCTFWCDECKIYWKIDMSD